MEIIDQVFLVVFARYRRKVGEANLQSAWRSASNKVSGYLAMPLVSVFLLAVMLIYSVKLFGQLIDPHTKGIAQLIGGLLAVAVAFQLDRRFKKYLHSPPALPAEESRTDRMLLFRIRAIAFGAIAFTLLMAVLLGQLRTHGV